MNADDPKAADEIHALIDARLRAVHDKDVLALMSGYALDVVTFDLVAPLSNLGAERVRERVVEWFASFEGPIEYELRDVILRVAGDVAFDHHLTHVRGKARSGAAVDMWFRETIGYEKIAGAWKVTHQHSSVPFDMSSGEVRLDLSP